MASPFLDMFSAMAAGAALMDIVMAAPDNTAVAEDAAFFALTRVALAPAMLVEIEHGTLPTLG
jgi:hypothetical protein